jgi:hypothetical protein
MKGKEGMMFASRKSLCIWLQIAAAAVLCLGAFNTQAPWLSASPEPGITTGEPQKGLPPDLVVTSINKHVIQATTVVDSHGVPVKKTKYRVQIRVENRGVGHAGQFKIRVEAQLNLPDTGSTWIDWRQVAMLDCKGLRSGAGINFQVEDDTFVDSDHPTYGSTFRCFRATADPGRILKEINITNNTLTMTDCRKYVGLEFTDQRTPKPPWPAKADLVVRSFRKEVIKQSTLDYSIPPTVIREYRLHVTVLNIGKGAAGPFKVLLEKKPQPDAWGGTYEIVTQLKCGGLMPGKSISLKAPMTFKDIDGGMDPKWWCFKAAADSENEVQETNEANNILIQTNCKQY